MKENEREHMSYDAILMGLISRVQKLELQVTELNKRVAELSGEPLVETPEREGVPDAEYVADVERSGIQARTEPQQPARRVPTRTVSSSAVRTTPPPVTYVRPSGKVTTMDVRDYIDFCRRYAAEHGDGEVILRSGEVHKFLRMRNSMPSVCNAMYTSMNDGDEVLDSSPSGYSSTLTIAFKVRAKN